MNRGRGPRQKLAGIMRDPRLRKVLERAVPVLGLLLVGLFILPGVLHVGEDAAHESAFVEVDPAWALAAPEDAAAEAAPNAYAALEPYLPEGSESLHEIDDSWLEGRGTPEAEDDASALACIIEPSQVIEIGSSVTGLIEKVYVERSDFVEAGQVLLELESGAELATVELARAEARMNEQIKSRKASASLSKRRRDRLQKLYEEQTLSLDLREEVETEAELAQLELAQARADKRVAALQLDRAIAVLKRRTIRSPISGVVVDRMMSPGERVDEEPILKVAQIDPLRVEVILPSSMFGSVTVGMRAAVVPEFPGDKVHVASVAIVDRVIDAASGTFGVRLALPNPHHEIPGGLHCQVRFLSE